MRVRAVRAASRSVAAVRVVAIHRREVWQSIVRECTVVAAMTASEPNWLPMATALHRLIGGSSHFDWFFGQSADTSDPDIRSARTFRCTLDPRGARAGWMCPLEALTDHRAHYLTTTTERRLADGSTVTPLQRGQWMNAGSQEIIIRWNDSDAFHRIRLIGQPPTRAECAASGPNLRAV